MQNIDVSAIFDFFGVSGQNQLKPEFEDFSREVSERTRTIAFPPPGPPLPPLTPPPAPCARPDPHMPPLSPCPVCSWQADCATSASSWAAILESIVGSVKRREWGWSNFFVALPAARAPPRAVLCPRTGLVRGGFFSESCDAYKVYSVSRTVCHPGVHVSTFQ